MGPGYETETELNARWNFIFLPAPKMTPSQGSKSKLEQPTFSPTVRFLIFLGRPSLKLLRRMIAGLKRSRLLKPECRIGGGGAGRKGRGREFSSFNFRGRFRNICCHRKKANSDWTKHQNVLQKLGVVYSLILFLLFLSKNFLKRRIAISLWVSGCVRERVRERERGHLLRITFTSS